MTLYNLRAIGGRIGAARTRDVRLERRRQGMTVHVITIKQNRERVPAIRLSGKWLSRLGFRVGDAVVLTAIEGKITIERKNA